MVLRKVARVMVCGAEGGKKRETSVAVDGSPVSGAWLAKPQAYLRHISCDSVPS